MQGEGELRGGHAEAVMGVVTCHGGMEMNAAPGVALIVREYLLQRVLRADVGSVGGADVLAGSSPCEDGYTTPSMATGQTFGTTWTKTWA